MARDERDRDLERLDALVGEWTMHARPPAGAPWGGGEGRVGFEWLGDRGFLVQRWSIEAPEAPDGIALIGPGSHPRGFRQHYFDSRGVHRLYEMTLDDGVWTLWRDAPDPFPQRYIGTFDHDGARISGRWEKDEGGTGWALDFELDYRRLERP